MTQTESRVAFYADTHYRNDKATAYWAPPKNLDVEAILLGGDIHYKPEHLREMLQGIRDGQRDDTVILYIPGNGDYIDQDIDESRAGYREAVSKIKNTVFLDNAVYTLPSGVRVIGSTLWSYIPEDDLGRYTEMLEGHGLKGVDDIRRDGEYISLADTNEYHAECVAFIEGKLRALSPQERERTIVCTHFFPTLEWLDRGQELHQWRSIIGSELDAMLRDVGPKLWLCGHLHETKDLTVGMTRVYCNPRAGSVEGRNPEFNETAILTLTASGARSHA